MMTLAFRFLIGVSILSFIYANVMGDINRPASRSGTASLYYIAVADCGLTPFSSNLVNLQGKHYR